MGLRQRKYLGERKRWSRRGLSIVGMDYKDVAKVAPDEVKLLKMLKKFIDSTHRLELDVRTKNMLDNFHMDMIDRVGHIYNNRIER